MTYLEEKDVHTIDVCDFLICKIAAGTCNSKFHLFFTEKPRSEYMSCHLQVKRKLVLQNLVLKRS